MVVSCGDNFFEEFGNRSLGNIRCDSGDMMCLDFVLGCITMVGGCSLWTYIEWWFLIHRFYT